MATDELGSVDESSSTVFNSYEVLEQILLHLNVNGLYILQRVSKQWQSLSNRSMPLQRKMFLISCTGFRASPDDFINGGLNFPNYKVPLYLNPALHHIVNKPKSASTSLKWRWVCRNHAIWTSDAALNWVELEGLDTDEISDSDSWKTMFTTQPPCTTMVCQVSGSTGLSIRDDAGITFRHLQEVKDARHYDSDCERRRVWTMRAFFCVPRNLSQGFEWRAFT